MEKGSMDGMATGAVYVQTNEPHNEVIAYRRDAEGILSRLESYATGGKGDGMPHLTSQGSILLTGDRTHLLVANASSDDVSLFAVGDRGLELVGATPAGSAPKSIAEHDGLVFVLNTGEPAIAGFRITAGGLEPIMGAVRSLEMGSDPAQVGFASGGSTLVVTQRGNDSIVSFAVGMDGAIGEPVRIDSSGPTPYGFAVTGDGTLVVTEAFRAEKGAAAASSYRIEGSSVAPITTSVGNGRSEICWAVVTPDDRFAFTTNFADGAVSRYAIGIGGALTLEDATAGIALEGMMGLRDEDLSDDGRFLYAIDADSQRIFGWSVDADGSLSAIASWNGLPATVAGLAAS